MRRSALFVLSAALLAGPALAADLGTYRPGTPYHATPVPSADVCASSCSGDARCMGWNYVKPAPQAQGVCELQSQIGSPVSSAISISGLSGTQPLGPGRVTQGGTNTIRVGTDTMPTARPSVQPAPSGRRVVRQPVPRQAMPAPTAHRRPAQPPVMAPAPRPAPRFAPMLDGTARRAPAPTPRQQQRQPQPHPQPMQYPHAGHPQATAPRGPARQRHAGQGAPRPSAQAMRPAPHGRVPHAAQGRPPVGQPIAPAMAPRPAAPAAPMTSRSAAEPMTFEQAQTSLYGSLHDDVAAPAPNAPVPTDPNAPMSLSQSRPVMPVATEALAGALPR